MLIAAAAPEIDIVGVLGQPERATRLVAVRIEVLSQAEGANPLIFETVDLHGDHVALFEVVDQQLELGYGGIAG